MAAETNVKIFVNDDVTGEYVGMILENCSFIEAEGQLHPMVQMPPTAAMRLAEALVECAGKLIARHQSAD